MFYSKYVELKKRNDLPVHFFQASDSEPEDKAELENAHAFANHYVNDPIRQSWKRNKTPSAAAYSYTDSEADSQYQYAAQLNGGQIIMNNMAGSRAPLPGFSSFV